MAPNRDKILTFKISASKAHGRFDNAIRRREGRGKFMAQITILSCGLLSAAAGAALAFFLTTIFDTNLLYCLIAASFGAIIGSLLGWNILRSFLAAPIMSGQIINERNNI